MAEKIAAYRFTKRFKKEYKALPQQLQNRFNEKLTLFLADSHHPSLRIKRIQGTKDRWEGSVGMKYRFTFQFSGGVVIFRNIGTHAILKRQK